MTKAELISALEWFKDDAELHIVVPHEALDDLHEVLSLDSARYNLIPPRVELVAKRPTQETPVTPTRCCVAGCDQNALPEWPFCQKHNDGNHIWL